MHPVIRIISLLVLGTMISFGNPAGVVTAAGLVIALYFFTSTAYFATAWRSIRRLRWLFLSILIIYLWFTPAATGGSESFWLPSIEGGIQGAVRMLTLIILVLAANLLLRTTTREQIVSALLWLTFPLHVIGFPHERFAVRMTLVLETVIQARGLLDAERNRAAGSSKNPIARISATMTDAYKTAVLRAEQTPCIVIEVPDLVRPPIHQWLYPLAMGAMFWVVNRL
jgi:hypothetical protein